MMLILLNWLFIFLIFVKREEFRIVLSRVYSYECPGLIVGKARLGTVVHQKTAAILTLTEVRPEDKNALATLSATIKVHFPSLDDAHYRRIIMTNL